MLKTAGETLGQERHKKNLTFEDIEKATHIRAKNLEAIEQSNWGLFPSRTYIQGIITVYGRHLGLDTELLQAYFRREYEKHEQLKFKTRATKSQFTPQTRQIIRITIVIIFVLFALYFSYQLILLFRPPSVTILEPQQTTFTKEKKILLKGTTAKDTSITINDERVYLNDENIFQTEIPLTKEENKVIIKAVGANGQKKTITLTYTRRFEEE